MCVRAVNSVRRGRFQKCRRQKTVRCVFRVSWFCFFVCFACLFIYLFVCLLDLLACLFVWLFVCLLIVCVCLCCDNSAYILRQGDMGLLHESLTSFDSNLLAVSEFLRLPLHPSYFLLFLAAFIQHYLCSCLFFCILLLSCLFSQL